MNQSYRGTNFHFILLFLTFFSNLWLPLFSNPQSIQSDVNSALSLSQQSFGTFCASLGNLLYDLKLEEEFQGEIFALGSNNPIYERIIRKQSVRRCIVDTKFYDDDKFDKHPHQNAAANYEVQQQSTTGQLLGRNSRRRGLKGLGKSISQENANKACFFPCDEIVYNIISQKDNVYFFVVVVMKKMNKSCDPLLPQLDSNDEKFKFPCFHFQKILPHSAHPVARESSLTQSNLEISVRSLRKQLHIPHSNDKNSICESHVLSMRYSGWRKEEKLRNFEIIPSVYSSIPTKKKIPIIQCAIRYHRNKLIVRDIVDDADKKAICKFGCESVLYNITTKMNGNNFVQILFDDRCFLSNIMNCHISDFDASFRSLLNQENIPPESIEKLPTDLKDQQILGPSNQENIFPEPIDLKDVQIFGPSRLPLAAAFEVSAGISERANAIRIALGKLRKRAGFSSITQNQFTVVTRYQGNSKFKVIFRFKTTFVFEV